MDRWRRRIAWNAFACSRPKSFLRCASMAGRSGSSIRSSASRDRDRCRPPARPIRSRTSRCYRRQSELGRAATRRRRTMRQEELLELGFDGGRLARVGEAIERDIAAERYHGAALIVARRGRTVVDLVMGYADRNARRRLGKDAVFATMSVAKQFTNVLAL